MLTPTGTTHTSKVGPDCYLYYKQDSEDNWMFYSEFQLKWVYSTNSRHWFEEMLIKI